ncbi:hypothetical protein [Actinomadura sp. 9N407]|uniref:hypothetical protein n=1 Tax=Actinomadura sp. 9N407 TaxID=3375154 RepID=UPI0037950F91
MSGWNPPPAPGGPPPGGYGYGAPGPIPYAPPPPRRSSGTGLIIGLLAGGFVLLVFIVLVVVVVIGANASHTISTPSTAGGMSRDYATESRISAQLASQRSIIRRATNYRISNVKSAVYESGSDKYLFVGGTGDFDPDDLTSMFRRAVDQETGSNVSTSVIPLANAGGDGEAVCATVRNRQTSLSTYSTAICAWATGSSFGTLMPVPDSSSLTTSRSYLFSTVADVMRRMRDDVES